MTAMVMNTEEVDLSMGSSLPFRRRPVEESAHDYVQRRGWESSLMTWTRTIGAS